MLLQLLETAVMVGGHKTLGRHNLAGAEVAEGLTNLAETDNGILQAALVYIVDVFRG